MYIQKLILKDYKRLRLTPIDYLEYTPTKEIQLIIGTNGSGKTSVLEELSPLPADSKDFGKEGFKYIEILHNKSLYILKSSFNPNEHSFIMDNEELNPGKTVTVQRELVNKHFGITNEVHQLALGKKAFTRMSIAERKHWITKISDMDFEYAIRFFNKLKETHRDISGALKVSKSRLTSETAKIITDAEFQKLQEETEQLDKCIEFLVKFKAPIEHSTKELYNRYQELTQTLESLLDTIKRKITYFISNGLYDFNPAKLEKEIIERKYQEQLLNTQATTIFQRYQEVQDKIDFLSKTKAQSLAQIETQITSFEEQCKALKQNKVFDFTFSITQGIDLISSIERELENVLPRILPDSEKLLGKEYQTLKTKLETLQFQEQSQQKTISSLTLRIEHGKKHEHDKKVDCPRCQYSWQPFFDPERIQADIAALKVQTDLLNTTQEALKATKTRLEELQEHNQCTEYFFRLIRNYSVLEPFWVYILDKDIFYHAPTQVLTQLNLVKQDIAIEEQVLKLTGEINDKLQLLQLSKQYSDINVQAIESQKQELEKEQLKIQLLQSSNLEALNKSRSLLADVESILKLGDALEHFLSDYEILEESFYSAIQKESYQALYQQTQSYRAQKEQVFQEARNQKSRIQDLTIQIENLDSQEKALKAAVAVLSPTEGLIAESLFGFMNLFIKQVNAIIKKIWTYPLIVKPCKSDATDKIDLDYKFPVLVDTPDNCRVDISEGSTAMQEVINLSFRIAAFKALGLNDYPIYLDEFGSSMDEAHKAATVNLIQTLIEQDHFTQVFLISHDVEQYGALSNTQTFVLNTDNIQIPPGCEYNKHVIIH